MSLPKEVWATRFAKEEQYLKSPQNANILKMSCYKIPKILST